MKRFTNKDIENYYDQTEVHYRMHWKLEEGMGLHYGIWDENTKNLAEAVLNSNYRLMVLGGIKPTDMVLDAGCGIGGSSVYLAKNLGCNVRGITLSEKQVKTATELAAKKGVGDKVQFSQQDYTKTNFADNTFDIAWCIESMETATDKTLFFNEMRRILKPGGKILVADIFKPQGYDMSKEKDMQVMLNGWAMSDILSIDELHATAEKSSFKVTGLVDVSKNVLKSVNRMYFASIIGAVGTKAYNMIYNASHFSKIHYKTGFAQKKAYHQNKWGYYLVAIENRK
jgi:cyclopropane fatty-acyl-phospholipid synthase-like methyltransferase